MRGTIESLAQMIADLSRVSLTQWLLRSLAAAALVAGLLLAVEGKAFDGVVTSLMTLAVIVCGLIQSVLPDSPLGALALAAIAVAAITTGPPGAVGLAIIGACLLLAHCSWALAAMIPAHGRIGRRALGAGAVGASVAALMAAGAGALVVLPLAQVRTPQAVMVLGVLALIILIVLLVPHGTSARRSR